MVFVFVGRFTTVVTQFVSIRLSNFSVYQSVFQTFTVLEKKEVLNTIRHALTSEQRKRQKKREREREYGDRVREREREQ